MAPECILTTAERWHVPLLASRMREADKAEVLASGGYTPEEALRSSLERSEVARTAWVGSEPLCMFGVLALADGRAVPWLLSTDVVDRYPLTFWRSSKVVIAQLHAQYPVLIQAVDARYTQALSWVRRLGFSVGPAVPFGVQGQPFHPIQLGA